jgi:purine-binding chemotaxis protein CheW
MSRLSLPPSGLAEDVLGLIKGMPDEIQIVTFSLDEQYGIPISQVQEIIRISSITRIPNSPSHMEGVINLRGRILPVLNLRKRLKMPVSDITRKSRIIVTEINHKEIGLLVDAVLQVIKVPSELIDNAPEEVLDIDSDYITGVCRLTKGLVILLDLERLLRREQINLKEDVDIA